MGFYAIYPPTGGSTLPTGAATSANQTTQIGLETQIEANTGERGQQNMANSFPVVIASNQSAIAVTGPLTDTQLRATAVPVSGTVSTNGLTDAQLRAAKVPVNISTTSGQALTANGVAGALDVFVNNTSVPVRGDGVNATAVTSNTLLVSGSDAGTQRNLNVDSTGKLNVNVSSTVLPPGAATEATLSSIDSKLTSPLAVTGPLTDAQLRATAVPVSGTVSTGGLTDAQLRATAVPVSVSSSALPAGAATEATLSALNAKVTAVNTGAVVISSGSVAVSNFPATQPVSVAATLTTSEEKSNTATLSNVASSASSVTLLSSNASRMNATFYNDSTQICYVKFGTTASSTSYTIQMAASSYYELPVGRIYTGSIDAIWASANGNMRVTELS